MRPQASWRSGSNGFERGFDSDQRPPAGDATVAESSTEAGSE